MVHDTSKHAETLALWRSIAAARPPPALTPLVQLFGALTWRTPAPERLAAPVLVMVSQTDALTAPECGATLARHLRAPLLRHPTAGHDLTTDAPRWVAAAVRRWVTDGDAAPPEET